MNVKAAASIIIALVLNGSVRAQQDVSASLFSVARAVVPAELSDADLRNVLDSGLWNPEGTSLAVVISRAEASLVLVFLPRPEGSFLATDASGVEGGNFGKLGRPRTDYERYETQPVEWRQRDDGRFQVVMRTRAWRMGQRYTVSEALLIDPDGTVLYR